MNREAFEKKTEPDLPLVSVIMSVYNTDLKLLDRAVRSILDQTYDSFEFIIIDDECDGDCRRYLNEISDSRVVIIKNNRNIGLAASLNKGIELAKGKYIARMDADDYSFPERLYEQADYLEKNVDVDVLAAIALVVMDGHCTGGIGGAYYDFDSELFRIMLSFGPKSFPHPTVMFRTSFLKRNNLKYDETFLRSQDYDMWARCALYGRFYSYQKPLLLYNTDMKKGGVISEEQLYFACQTKLRCLKRLLPMAGEKECYLYSHMNERDLAGTVADNIELVLKLIRANDEAGLYDKKKYARVIYFLWGRKMMYVENRTYFKEFLRKPGFVLSVVISFIYMAPAHILQFLYVKKKVWVCLRDKRIQSMV